MPKDYLSHPSHLRTVTSAQRYRQARSTSIPGVRRPSPAPLVIQSAPPAAAADPSADPVVVWPRQRRGGSLCTAASRRLIVSADEPQYEVWCERPGGSERQLVSRCTSAFPSSENAACSRKITRLPTPTAPDRRQSSPLPPLLLLLILIPFAFRFGVGAGGRR